MKTTIFSSIFILFAAFFCNSQRQPKEVNNTPFNPNQILPAKGEIVPTLGKNIMVIYQDKKNNYWFGSWETGLYKYSVSQGNTITHFTTKDGLSHNRVEEIREDRLGNLYFNTKGGINKYDGVKFSKLEISSNVNPEWKLEPDDLWFKCLTYCGQVYRYDGKYLYCLSLPKIKIADDYIAKHPANGINPYSIYSIYKDLRGNIWFGGSMLGLCRYNGNTFDWITEVDVTELHEGPSNGVRSMVEDKSGYFWFNTMYRYNVYSRKKQQKDTHLNKTIFYDRIKGIGSLDGKPDGNLNEFLSITRDNNNHIWIATYRDGIWKYDAGSKGQRKKITHCNITQNEKTIHVFSIYKDNNGSLWLGTPENGAYKFNGKTFEKFKPIDK